MNTPTSVTVIIPGVPPSWSQWRGRSLERDLAKKVWRDRTWFLAHSERNRAGWPMPTHHRRWLTIVVYKYKPLLDEDNCVAALKPLIDGLKGPLLVDDKPAYCSIVTAPCDMQRELLQARDQRVEITVHLADPRAAYCAEQQEPRGVPC